VRSYYEGEGNPMKQMIEVRYGSGVAFEVSTIGGEPIQYADTEARLLALGCPSDIARRSAQRYQRQVDGRSALSVDPALADLDVVRDRVNRWHLGQISKIVAEDKAKGYIR